MRAAPSLPQAFRCSIVAGTLCPECHLQHVRPRPHRTSTSSAPVRRGEACSRLLRLRLLTHLLLPSGGWQPPVGLLSLRRRPGSRPGGTQDWCRSGAAASTACAAPSSPSPSPKGKGMGEGAPPASGCRGRRGIPCLDCQTEPGTGPLASTVTLRLLCLLRNGMSSARVSGGRSLMQRRLPLSPCKQRRSAWPSPAAAWSNPSLPRHTTRLPALQRAHRGTQQAAALVRLGCHRRQSNCSSSSRRGSLGVGGHQQGPSMRRSQLPPAAWPAPPRAARHVGRALSLRWVAEGARVLHPVSLRSTFLLHQRSPRRGGGLLLLLLLRVHRWRRWRRGSEATCPGVVPVARVPVARVPKVWVPMLWVALTSRLCNARGSAPAGAARALRLCMGPRVKTLLCSCRSCCCRASGQHRAYGGSGG